MGAQPLSPRELEALHDRIAKDVAELRSRLRRRPAPPPRPSDDLVKAAVEMAHRLRAAPGLAAGVGVALMAVAGALAGRAVRMQRR